MRRTEDVNIVPGTAGRGALKQIPPGVIQGACKVFVSGKWEDLKNIKVQYSSETREAERGEDAAWTDTSGGNIPGSGAYKYQMEEVPQGALWVAINTVDTFTQGDPPVIAILVVDG